jgi:segregation and condensation protein B
LATVVEENTASEICAAVEPAHIAAVEAMLFACGEPLSVERLSEASGLEFSEVKLSLDILRDKLSADESGLALVEVGGCYQLRTKAVFAPFVQALKASRPRKLSNAALETLSIVAYRQPIVKSDIEKIRGVDATPTIKTLLERGLIKIVGHAGTVGQPALYGTSDDFLKLFGLGSLAELPTLRDLAEIEADPGETEERIDDPAAGRPEVDEALVAEAANA